MADLMGFLPKKSFSRGCRKWVTAPVHKTIKSTIS